MNRWLLASLVHECCEKQKIPTQVLASALYLMDNAVALLKDAHPKEKAWHEKCEPLLIAAVCIHLASKMECCYTSLTSLLTHFFFSSPSNSSGPDGSKHSSHTIGYGAISANEMQKQTLYDQANSIEALLVVEMGINAALPPRPVHWELHRVCQEWRISPSLRTLSFHILFQLLTITPFAGRYSSRILTALCLFIASQWLQEEIVTKASRRSIDPTGESQEGWWCQIHGSLRRRHLVALTEQWLQACRQLPMKIRIELSENKVQALRQELKRIEENMDRYPHLDSIFINIDITKEGAASNASNAMVANETNARNGTPTVEETNNVSTDGLPQESEKESANVPNKQRISMKDYRQKLQTSRPTAEEAPQSSVPHSSVTQSAHNTFIPPSTTSKNSVCASLSKNHEAVSNMSSMSTADTTGNAHDTAKLPHHSRQHSRERTSSTSDGSITATTSSGHHRHHKSHHHHHHKHHHHSHHEHTSSTGAHKHSHKKRRQSSEHEHENILSNLLQSAGDADDMDISPS